MLVFSNDVSHTTIAAYMRTSLRSSGHSSQRLLHLSIQQGSQARASMPCMHCTFNTRMASVMHTETFGDMRLIVLSVLLDASAFSNMCELRLSYSTTPKIILRSEAQFQSKTWTRRHLFMSASITLLDLTAVYTQFSSTCSFNLELMPSMFRLIHAYRDAHQNALIPLRPSPYPSNTTPLYKFTQQESAPVGYKRGQPLNLSTHSNTLPQPNYKPTNSRSTSNISIHQLHTT